MKVESFNFIPFVTAIALFSVVDAFQSLKQRFDFKNLGQRTDQLTRNSIHSLQSVLENRKSDFADIDINEITKKEQSPFDYNWKQQWYAVTYDFNLPTIKDQKPLAYSVFDQELTFWRDEQGVIRCSEDKCPHRNARLSEGSVEDGKIECLYHGWKFDKSGNCIKIPQLLPDAVIPKQACVKMYSTAVKEGILWVWMDTPATADYNNIPSTQVNLDLNKKGWYRYDFHMDLPYDHSFLVENLLDPAHIPVSHDKTEGGGSKENAQPLIIKLTGDLHAKGFEGTLQNTRKAFKKDLIVSRWLKPFMRKSPLDAAPEIVRNVSFEAPGIVRYHTESKGLTFGAALHCMPMGRSRSRLFFTTFIKGPPLLLFIAKLKPIWLRNLNSCKVLEQDVGLITSQEDMLTKGESEKIPAKEWLTMRSQDLLLVQYRKWLDIVGPNMPYYMGWRNKSESSAIKTDVTERVSSFTHRSHESRYFRHVIQNKNMVKALSNIVGMKKVSFLFSIISFGISGLFEKKYKLLSIATAAMCLLLSTIFSRLESSFYNNFYRFPTNKYAGK